MESRISENQLVQEMRERMVQNRKMAKYYNRENSRLRKQSDASF